MVNTMDLGRGFLKLQEDNNSRRSSSLFRQKPLELNENGIHYVTRINCGCGQCVPFRVKVEKDDGGLRIGKLTLATNCHLIIVIFGFFFLIAGSVLTALAYKEPAHDPDLSLHERASTEQGDSPSRQEGKVAGPIFIIFGSALVLVGFSLTALACKLNRDAKRQLHLSRFTWETPPIQTPDIFNNSSTTPNHHQQHFHQSGENLATFTNSMDTFSVRSRELSTGSANSGGGGGGGIGRRDSSFTFSRQNPPPPLSTIAQAVPVGIFLFGGGPDSTTSPKSPSIQVTDPSGFQEIELGSPTTESAPASASAYSSRHNPKSNNIPPDAYKKYRSHSASDGSSDPADTSRPYESNRNLTPTTTDATGQSKVNLGLRPSLPIIPMFAPPSSASHYFSRSIVTPLDARSLYVSSRSDEPFGSIASLSTSGDIACFPVSTTTKTLLQSSSTGNGNDDNNGVMEPTPECDEESSTSPLLLTRRSASSSNQSSCGANIANNNDNCSSSSSTLVISNDKKKRNYQGNDVNLNKSKRSSIDDDDNIIADPKSSVPSRNTTTTGISELPPINVNDYGSKVNRDKANGRGATGSSSTTTTGNVVGFQPKSILRHTKSEDWQQQDETSAEEEAQLKK